MKPIDPQNSPCTGVCVIGLEGNCKGCGRTTEEIAEAGRQYAAKKRAEKANTMVCYACRGKEDRKASCLNCDGEGTLKRT